MLPDKVGPMGWWWDQHEPAALTLFRERSRFSAMEDAAPERFIAQAAPQVASPVILKKIDELQQADGFGNGTVNLRYIEKLCFGQTIPFKAQNIGSCVASGAMRGLVLRMLWEVVALGDPEDLLGKVWTGRQNIAPFAPYHYGWGRYHAGISGNGDGSTCSGQIEALMTNGWLPCDTPGLESDDYPEPQNNSTYKAWGAHKHIKEFEPHGKVFDLTESERVSDTGRLIEVIKEFKPVMICSGWGFQPQSKHKEGFTIYKRSGSWAHNMTIVGVIITADGDVFFVVLNSWGENAHKDGPYFVVPESVMAAWLRPAEARTLGQLKQRETTPQFWTAA